MSELWQRQLQSTSALTYHMLMVWNYIIKTKGPKDAQPHVCQEIEA